MGNGPKTDGPRKVGNRMSGGLMILLIIVVWLFVLAPLLLRGQKPMTRAGEAFEDTRVVYSGDSGEVPARPQLRLRPTDVRRRTAEDDEEYEIVAAEAAPAAREDDLLIDEPRSRRDAVVDGSVVDGSVVDGELVDASAVQALTAGTGGSTAASVLLADDDREGADDETETETETGTEHIEDTDVAELGAAGTRPDDAEDAYDVDDAYLTPEDLLYRGAPNLALVAGQDDDQHAGSTAVDAEELAELHGQEGADEDFELTEDEIAWAQSRPGRGGWDPERDRTYSTTRYQRRRRTLLGLTIAVVLAVALGIVAGGWAWLATAVAGGLTVLYLFALRRQVQEEQALRARRVRHLRRARLGVRSADAEDLQIPQQLRRPGAVVMELDDESPDFTHLPSVNHYDRPLNPRPRNNGNGSLRVG